MSTVLKDKKEHSMFLLNYRRFIGLIFIGHSLFIGHVHANIAVKPAVEVWINVFVHGIKSVKPHIGISNFIRFMTDDIDNTVYSETVRLMREDPHFYQNQAMQELGLQVMDSADIRPGNASGAMAVAFERISQFANPDRQIENQYYTFGWSGLLSVSGRYCAAIDLYEAVAQKVAELKEQGIDARVRIIGYSHGGNVVLNLGLVRQSEPDLLPLSVDEAFLLGVPVQNETDYLINDEIFKKIYHIYSRGDRIQKLDFFSFNRFFSHRLFKPRRGFCLPDKLLQIQLKCTRNAATLCNDPQKEAVNYRFDNLSIQTGRSCYLRDCSPGHTELWFFGWTPLHYRENFVLNPLPSAILVPLIARYAENFQERSRYEKPTLIDIRPQQEVVLTRNQKSKKAIVFGKFLPKAELNQLKETIMLYAPLEYTDQDYNAHIQEAFLKAQEWHSQQEHEQHWDGVAARHERKHVRKVRKRERKADKKSRKVCKE
jgi:hypothetical protein